MIKRTYTITTLGMSDIHVSVSGENEQIIALRDGGVSTFSVNKDRFNKGYFTGSLVTILGILLGQFLSILIHS